MSRLRSPRSAEDGSATIEMAVLLPMLLVLLFCGVQAALLHQARSLAVAAASAGAHAVGAEYGTPAAGIAAAKGFLTESAEDAFSSYSVTASASGTTASVTVTGVSLSIVPFWTPEVRQTSSVPREEVSAP
jgi:Flp pilus assembly protein TadG